MSALGVKDEAPKPRMFSCEQIDEAALYAADQTFGEDFDADEGSTIKMHGPASLAASLVMIDHAVS
jgi:hypothetical protein